ncbi:unnamed protein product [Nyctereutes procyonoides]|uniref:(raccoon dog) hypothetical protein n=1 Tax=Nyctereutes procyonoides TaxID=34880 RepID=A0A811YEY7_NYCPR|nr:unnamed protein product [Nyctereutes procyonoides]
MTVREELLKGRGMASLTSVTRTPSTARAGSRPSLGSCTVAAGPGRRPGQAPRPDPCPRPRPRAPRAPPLPSPLLPSPAPAPAPAPAEKLLGRARRGGHLAATPRPGATPAARAPLTRAGPPGG